MVSYLLWLISTNVGTTIAFCYDMDVQQANKILFRSVSNNGCF